jgi:hypothetical protein
VLAAGCIGQIGSPSGQAPGPRGPTPADQRAQAANPSLFAIAMSYFPGQQAAGAPKRLSRLTRTQLDVTTKALLPAYTGPTAVTTLPPDPLQTNYEYAANLSFNDANFTPYSKWVDGIAASVRANPTSVIDCTASNNAPACLQAACRTFVARAFRGAATDTQLSRFADFFATSVAQVGLPDATADLVTLVMMSPGYVFRDEVQTDTGGSLLPAQRLQNVTYTLADAPPEALGLSSAAPAPALASAAAAQQTVDKILATPEARAKLMRFFLSWLEVREPDQFTIDPTAFPEFTPAVAAAAVEETKSFLAKQLAAAAPRLKDVTQSTQSFVSAALASIYGVTNPSATSLVDLDPAQRLGIFTQPAVIASHSGPTTTRLVKRGVFFVRKVMCMPLGQPPAGIDTSVPASAGATERDRIQSVTAQAPCSGCHAVINPFGFMLESFDPIGRWRTTDAGHPVDTSVSVSFLDEGPLMTTTSVDALKGFTTSMRFKQCFARQLFRFYLGRDEIASDDPLLRQMFFDFANNDEQAIVPLLKTLGSAPALSQRTEAP